MFKVHIDEKSAIKKLTTVMSSGFFNEGVQVKEFSNNEYDRVIDLITNNYKPNQKSIIETSHSYYSLEKGVEKYKEVYLEILGK